MFGGLKDKVFGRADQPVEAEPEAPCELRNAEREDVFADIILQTTSGLKKQGIVLDLSQCGARLRFVAADCMTEKVRVEIPRLRMKRIARVRWQTRTDLGVEFID